MLERLLTPSPSGASSSENHATAQKARPIEAVTVHDQRDSFCITLSQKDKEMGGHA